jgi:hypothetical protein
MPVEVARAPTQRPTSAKRPHAPGSRVPNVARGSSTDQLPVVRIQEARLARGWTAPSQLALRPAHRPRAPASAQTQTLRGTG